LEPLLLNILPASSQQSASSQPARGTQDNVKNDASKHDKYGINMTTKFMYKKNQEEQSRNIKKIVLALGRRTIST
jgi:hypothetical protein